MSVSDRIRIARPRYIKKLITEPDLFTLSTYHFHLIIRGETEHISVMYPREKDVTLRPSEDLYVYLIRGPTPEINGVSYEVREYKKGGHIYKFTLTVAERNFNTMIEYMKPTGIIKTPSLDLNDLLHHMREFYSRFEQEEEKVSDRIDLLPAGYYKELLSSMMDFVEEEIEPPKVMWKIKEILESKGVASLRIENKETNMRILLAQGEVVNVKIDNNEVKLSGMELLKKILEIKGEVKLTQAILK
ncbi:hypothetical protein HS7_11190 [Sulfolobales archaeon HS-7]|nr:hypothetical protein HS7_11190 [Sulfolobales archaeon HS-7]